MQTSATSELYMDQDRAGSSENFQAPPPAPPSSIPPPTKMEVSQPVVTKSRMKDEHPDGSVRDTSTEALRPGNDLGFRNLDDEKLVKKDEEKPAEAAPPTEPKLDEKPPEPKVYAGKFKTPEDLEKGYSEAEKAMHVAMQEAADLRKKLETQETARAAAPPAPVVKTPEQLKTEQDENSKLLNDFVTNPKEFVGKQVEQHQQQMQVALAAAQTAEQWRKDNPDIAEHEIRVAFEAHVLQQSDPNLAKDPKALIDKATANFRQFTGKIRTAAAKEALTTETRTVPLLSNTAQPQAPEQPAKAPLTSDESYDITMRMLKEQEQRTRRNPLNRGR